MDGITFGRASLLCTLLLWALQVCSGSVTVKVTPTVDVIKGESASLPCTITGLPPSSKDIISWHIEDDTKTRVAYRSQGGDGNTNNDSPLSGRVTIGKDFTLTISNVQPTDELSFICQVAGPTASAEATTMLKVFFAPEKPELTRPSSQAISAGEPTSSEIGTCVTHNGHPQPRIIWFKDDQPLPEVKDRKEKTYMVPSVVREASNLFTIKSTLYMQPTKADKDSVFHCTVEYSLPGDQIKKKKSDTITINLNYPSETVTFTLLNTDPVKEGDNITMKCETDGNPQPSEFEFSKEGTSIAGKGGNLMLKSVKRSDAGVYKCEALDFDNLDGDLTKELTLSVNYIDPMSVTPAGPHSAKLGDAVEMQCKTKASSSHTVQWRKGSEVLSQTGGLSLKEVTYENAGDYVCVGAVPSVPGLTAETHFKLTVTGKPMIEAPAKGEVEKEGDMVTLKCSAFGHPAPQFTWKPQGKQSVSVEGNKVVSSLTLPATADVLKDGVTCEASNEHGTESKAFAVSIVRASPSNEADRADKQQGGSSGVVIAVVVCVLLLLLLVALLYFLNKSGKLPCSKKDKKEVASGEVNNDIVVEMKTEKANEEAGLLNKRPATEQ